MSVYEKRILELELALSQTQNELRAVKLQLQQAKAQVHHFNNVLHVILENVPTAIAIFDTNMVYKYVSKQWLTDYGVVNVLGKSHYTIFPTCPQRWKDIHRYCIQGGALQKNDCDPFQREDGSTTWVRWRVMPWYQESAPLQDIMTPLSGNKRTWSQADIESQSNSQKRFRVDDNYNSVDYITPPPSSSSSSYYPQLNMSNSPLSIDPLFPVPSSTTELGTYSFGTSRMTSGLIMMTDVVTNQKSLELALEAAQTVLGTFAHQAILHMGQLGPDGRYTFCNRYTQQLLGYEPNELIGKSITEFFYLDHPLAILEEDKPPQQSERRLGAGNAQYILKGDPVEDFYTLTEYLHLHGSLSTTKLRLRHRDGTPVQVRLQISMLQCATVNITTRTTYIVTASKLHTESAIPQNTDEETIRRQLLDKYGSSLLDTAQGIGFLKDTIYLKKLQQGEIKLSTHQCNVEQIISEALNVVSPLAVGKENLEILIKLDPTLPPLVFCDGNRLRQVLVNLLSNSIRFTEKGHVMIRVSRGHSDAIETSSLDLHSPSFLNPPSNLCSDRLRFEVLDSGQGIPEDKLGGVLNILDPVQLSSTSSTSSTSSASPFTEQLGLGLSICKLIVELMNGRLEVKSRLGQGTNFSFEIPTTFFPGFLENHHLVDTPAYPQERQPVAAKPLPTRSNIFQGSPLIGRPVQMKSDLGQQEKVLIAHSDSLVTDLLGEYLAAWGFRPIVAHSSRQVMEIIEKQFKHKPDQLLQQQLDAPQKLNDPSSSSRDQALGTGSVNSSSLISFLIFDRTMGYILGQEVKQYYEGHQQEAPKVALMVQMMGGQTLPPEELSMYGIDTSISKPVLCSELYLILKQLLEAKQRDLERLKVFQSDCGTTQHF